MSGGRPVWSPLADVSAGDLVLDVGAGRACITARLLRAGAHVVAIELHEQRVAFLREQFDGSGSPSCVPTPPTSACRGARSRSSPTRRSARRPRCSDGSPRRRAGSSGPASSSRRGPRRGGPAGRGAGTPERLRVLARPAGPGVGVPAAASPGRPRPAREPASAVALNQARFVGRTHELRTWSCLRRPPQYEGAPARHTFPRAGLGRHVRPGRREIATAVAAVTLPAECDARHIEDVSCPGSASVP